MLGTDAFRVSSGGWETREHSHAGVASFETLIRSGVLGFAVGATDKRVAGSIYGAHKTENTFAGGEIALSHERVRAVARMVSGSMSVIAIAGAGPANDEPLVFARKERWGGARASRWVGMGSESHGCVDSDQARCRVRHSKTTCVLGW
ncbi:MAG TPA: hypothetical protein VN852_11230 [Candidatus Krumholzibacteria bacterium]|nr:hypothetical protein [Candidatus Krumholzibacteria bacterium]